MTRLISKWIENTKDNIGGWNDRIKELTGSDLYSLARKAAGVPLNVMDAARENTSIAVVPVTSGMGIIGHFAESVAAIAEEIGYDVHVTECTDIEGIYRAYSENCDMYIAADDDRYIAVNTKTGAVGENDACTALGYIEVLDAMERKEGGSGICGEEVLVLGYGRVGEKIKRYLKARGCSAVIYDKNPEICVRLEKEGEMVLADVEQIIYHKLIIDATSEGGWLKENMIRRDALISSLGVPFSLDESACKKMNGRYVHDDLAIGTAVMLAMALGGGKNE